MQYIPLLQRPFSISRIGGISAAMLFLACCFILPCNGQEKADPNDNVDLTEMSLDALMGVKISTVSRKQQRLTDTAAAAYVISQEDIRRSGASNISELLQMVPGMDVAQINSSSWNISPRGLKQVFSKMILVQIDGRTIETPIFSGVNWDVVDTMLEDIDRIEIIRGPGSALWGANAVNGVINIITKSAADTRGPLITNTFSTDGLPSSSARFGGQSGSNTYYRLYAKGFDKNGYLENTGTHTHDPWKQTQAGFRVDSNEHKGISYTAQGNIYSGREFESFSIAEGIVSSNTIISGSNVLAKWSSTAVDGSTASLQMYYDKTRRRSIHLPETRDTFDVDYQNRIIARADNEIVWGLGYRHSRDSVSGSGPIAFGPSTGVTQLFSVFAQDDINMSDGRDCLTVGSKVEHNSVTGWEIQPNIRFLRKISEHRTVWLAVSRTVATPSRGEQRADINLQTAPGSDAPPPPNDGNVNNDLNSETMIAYELGYRTNIGMRASIDVAAFYNSYDNLRGFIFDGQQTIPGSVTTDIANIAKGSSYGLEIAPKWNVTDKWRLAAAYSLYKEDEHTNSSGELLGSVAAGGSPKNKLNLRSYLDLSEGRELDIFTYYVDGSSVTRINETPIRIPAYMKLDVRYGWHAGNSLEFSFGVQNLCNTRHNEYASATGIIADEIPRTYYLKTTWQL